MSSEETRTIGENPFVGPGPFRRGQKIYGRDREVRELFYLLAAERVVWLHSPSGAGKTSLVVAGLVPRLLEDGFEVWPTIRVQSVADAGTAGNRWVRSVVTSLEEDLPEGERTPDAELDRLTLGDYFRKRRRRGDENAGVVLVFDQFEEVLTLDPLDREAKRSFFEQLGEALRDRQLWALFALREDYLAPMSPYADLLPMRMSHTFRLDLLSLAAAAEAVTRTAREGGRDFPTAERMVRDLATVKVQSADGSFHEETGHHVEPVQLQVTCRRLWDEMPEDDFSIDPEDLDRFGDVTEALAAYYADAVARVAAGGAARERTIRDWFGERLIMASGVRDRVLKGPGESGGLANTAIEQLESAYLVRTETRAGATWFELAHDRLVNPVLADNVRWKEEHLSELQKRAALWQSQDRPPGLLAAGAELGEAERWAAEHEAEIQEVERLFLDESRKTQAAAEKELRRTKLVRRLALVSFAVGLLALGFWWQAREKAREASGNLALAFQERASAAHQAGDGPRTWLYSLEALTRELGEERLSLAAGYLLLPEVIPGSAPDVPGQDEAASDEADDDDVESARDVLSGRGEATSVRIGDDGHLLGVGTEFAAAKSRYTLWSLAPDGEPRRVRLGFPQYTLSFSFGPGGRWLAAGNSRDGRVVLLDVEALLAQGPAVPSTPLEPVHEDSHVSSLAWSGDGRQVAVGDEAGRVTLLEPEGGPPRELDGLGASVSSLAWSARGALAAGATDGTVKLWEVPDSEPISFVGTCAVYSLAWDATGRRLAWGDRAGTIRVIDAAAAGPGTAGPGAAPEDCTDAEPGQRFAVRSLAFHPLLPDLLASGDADGTITLWRLEPSLRLTGAATIRAHSGSVFDLAWSPDGALLASAASDGSLRRTRLHVEPFGDAELALDLTDLLLDPRAEPVRARLGKIRRASYERLGLELEQLDLKRPGDADPREADRSEKSIAWKGRVVTFRDVSLNGGGRKVKVRPGEPLRLDFRWTVETEREVECPGCFVQLYYGFASEEEDGPGFSRCLVSAQMPPAYRGSSAPESFGFTAPSTPGKYYVTLVGSYDYTCRDRVEMPSEKKLVKELDFARFRVKKASGSDPTGGAARLVAARVLEGHENPINSVSFSPGGDRVATAAGNWKDFTCRLWDAATGEQPGAGFEHEDAVLDVSFSPDGRRLATASRDGEAFVWDLGTGEKVTTLEGHTDAVNSVSFSPDGRRVVTASEDWTVIVWDAATSEQVRDLVGHRGAVNSASFSPDGTRVLTSSVDETARLWDVGTGEVLEILEIPEVDGELGSEVTAASWGPDGSRIVTAHLDGTARVWDLAAGEGVTLSVTLSAHRDALTAAAFSPDGTRIVTASFDETAIVWDAAAGAVLAVLEGHGHAVTSAAFSPDGSRVATASYDTTARTWRIPGGLR